MPIHNAADNSFKLIFGNHRLFLDFLADFIHIEILKDVKPEDIEDISERFIPLFQESRDSDTVKRITLKDIQPQTSGLRTLGSPVSTLFVIAILEHESKVNFRSSFKMLQYICLVLDAWEKEAENEEPGSSRRRDFKYPPVLPIIFYDGKDTWTAEQNFFERTYLNRAFQKYIPKFEYELINLNDYSEEKIISFGDALSLVLLIDKIRGNKGENLLRQLPSDYIEKLSLQIPESLVKLISDVIRVLLDKSGLERHEIEKYVSSVKKSEVKENTGMFEAVIESIIEGREEARKEGIAIGQERLKVAEERLEVVTRDSQKRLEAVARNALEEGLTIEFVSKITGFDMETIQEIKDKEKGKTE